MSKIVYVWYDLCQCIGPLSLTVDKMSKLQCVDAHVLIDALAYVIGSEEKEFCTPCIVALALILKTAVSILGSKEKVRGGDSFLNLYSKWPMNGILCLQIFYVLSV